VPILADVRRHSGLDTSRLQRSSEGLPLLDLLETAYLGILAGLTSAAWLAILLAEFGAFHAVAPLLFGGVVAVLVVRRLVRRTASLVAPLDLAGAVALVAVGTVLYFPADEWIFGAWDSGVYVNTGANIARTGGIPLRSTQLALLPAPLRDALITNPALPGPPSRLPLFYNVAYQLRLHWPLTLSTTPNVADPQGFHLYPSVLALGFAIGGIRTELVLTPVIAVLAVCGFYLLARRLCGSAVGFLAAFMYAISPAEVWFARYPAAEILVEFLLFGGFLAFVAMLDTSDPTLGFLAGLSIGEIHLTKIEEIPLVALVGLYALILVYRRSMRRAQVVFLATYAVLVVHATIHAALFSSFYSYVNLSAVARPLFGHLTLLVAVLLIALGTAFAADRLFPLENIGRFVVGDGRGRVIYQLGVAVIVPLLAAYAFYVRPLGSDLATSATATMATLERIDNLQSFLRLGWYISPLALLLGTVGWVFLLTQQLTRRSALFLGLVLFETLFFLYDLRVTPWHYWAARRWIAYAIPGFFLATAYVLTQFATVKRGQWLYALLPLCCGLAIIFSLLGSDRPLFGYVEYRGAVAQTEALVNQIPPGSITIFPDGDSGRRLTTPLQLIYGRTSLVFPPAARAAIQASAAGWLAEGKPVYWVATAGLATPESLGFSARIVGHQRISVPEKRVTVDTPPGADGLFQQDLIIWRLEPTPARSQTR